MLQDLSLLIINPQNYILADGITLQMRSLPLKTQHLSTPSPNQRTSY